MAMAPFRILLLLASFIYGGLTEDVTPVPISCMKGILEQTFVEYAAVYFADNPRGNVTAIDISAIDPLNADTLFLEQYGGEASPSKFYEAIMAISYNGLGTKDESKTMKPSAILEADRVALRDVIYTFVKAGSYEIAREKFSVLAYKNYREIAGNSGNECPDALTKKAVKDSVYSELAKLRNEVGEFPFGQFLNLGSGTTLAFAIDDTGSMSGEIAAAKRRAFSIIDERQGSLDRPQNFVLVPFNDPTVGPLTVTHDPDVFKKAISRLRAHGGGDAPELCMRGIQLAVENSNPGSTIFVITDVHAKDIELQDNVIAQAKHKHIKVTFLLTNRIQGKLCRTRTGAKCKNKALKDGYELYRHIAESTGGSILVVSKQSIFKATEVIESSLQQGLEHLYIKTLSPGQNRDHFYVDSSLKELILKTVGDCALTDVIKPDETKAALTSDVNVDRLAMWKINVDETFGRYSFKVKADSHCELTISAKSGKGFVQTLTKRVHSSDNSDSWFERFGGQALHDDDVAILIDEYGKMSGETTEMISLVSKDSDARMDFPIELTSANHHVVKLGKSHKESMLVMVSGQDKNGFTFQRVSQSPVEFVPLDIDCSAIENVVFRAGDTVSVDVNIKNLGSPGKYSVEASDSKSFVQHAVPTEFHLKKLQVKSIPVTFKDNSTKTVGTVTTVTITAKALSGGKLAFKQCRLVVGQKEKPDIESFKAVSNINSRFVETSVTSTVFNNASVSRMAEFNILMPRESFITEFTMTIDNVTYPGQIKEKEVAKRIFKAAKERGITAGHVAAREESTTVFKTSVNLEANKRVVFNLKYQQLLKRVSGKYRHEIIIQTKQPVGELSVDVYVCERKPLGVVEVLGFDTEQSVLPGPIKIPGVTVEQESTTAHISFKPTREEQLKLSPLGLNGKFVVEYDVERKRGKDDNEIIADDRHFIHFFSSEMDLISKKVVFALDTSASMHGRKMEQVRTALSHILASLNSNDHFAIITFGSNITMLADDPREAMVLANDANREDAEAFLASVEPTGSTNIELALSSATELLEAFMQESEKNEHPSSNFIILLTDGRPTEGTVNSKDLINSIDNMSNYSIGIHTIGFGSLVDMKTLKVISARNYGASIQIFEDIDADLQIFDFFQTVSRPILQDVEVIYSADQVSSTTSPTFPVLHGGSEIVIAGEFSEDFPAKDTGRRRRDTLSVQLVDVTISGKGEKMENFELRAKIEPDSPPLECSESVKQIENFTERLMIFMDLQNTVRMIDAEKNKTLKDELKEQALNKSLKYGFVTPGITSMVVLKPDDQEEIEEEIAREDAEEDQRKKEEEEKIEKPKFEEEEEDLTDRRGVPMLGEDGPPAFPESSRRIMGGTTGATRSFAFLHRPTIRDFGFFGDPHFLIDISPQLTLCFDWDGHEGQVFNLIHDPHTGLTVNGRLTIVRMNGRRNVYVNEIAIVLAKENIKIKFTLSNVTVTEGNGNSDTLSYRNTTSVVLSGMSFVVYAPSMQMSEVLLTIKDGIVFRVIVKTPKQKFYSGKNTGHMDFTVINGSAISDGAFGVLGQFTHDTDAGKKEPELENGVGKNSAILWYRKKPVHARFRKVRDNIHARTAECWFIPQIRELLDKGRFRYLLLDLFDVPDLKSPPRKMY